MNFIFRFSSLTLDRKQKVRYREVTISSPTSWVLYIGVTKKCGLKTKLQLIKGNLIRLSAPHPTPSNRPFFASLPRDLRNDATCTTRCRSFTSLEAKLGNASLTCYVTKQVVGCRHVSSQCFHPLIGFEAQNDKSPSTWF
jgi:hypothetical protein